MGLGRKNERGRATDEDSGRCIELVSQITPPSAPVEDAADGPRFQGKTPRQGLDDLADARGLAGHRAADPGLVLLI